MQASAAYIEAATRANSAQPGVGSRFRQGHDGRRTAFLRLGQVRQLHPPKPDAGNDVQLFPAGVSPACSNPKRVSATENSCTRSTVDTAPKILRE